VSGGPVFKHSFAEKRRIVAARRVWREEEASMTALGYRRHETDWEIHRGYRCREVIIDAKISQDGKYVWTLIGEAASPVERPAVPRDDNHIPHRLARRVLGRERQQKR
jgi:hypothetical protein